MGNIVHFQTKNWIGTIALVDEGPDSVPRAVIKTAISRSKIDAKLFLLGEHITYLSDETTIRDLYRSPSWQRLLQQQERRDAHTLKRAVKAIARSEFDTLGKVRRDLTIDRLAGIRNIGPGSIRLVASIFNLPTG